MQEPPSNAQHNDNAQYENRLAAVELAFKEHEHKAEADERESNKRTLVLYGVPEELQDKPCVDVSEIAHTNGRVCLSWQIFLKAQTTAHQLYLK